MKRPREEETSGSRKVRVLQHEQRKPAHIEPASQLPSTAGEQLSRSITAACALAGFDSVKPSALEMFRAQTEEYMLQFATEIQISMQGSRRGRPTAQDFTMALSRMPNTKAPRVLQAQLELSLPADLSYPTIPAPDAALETPPDLTALLQPLLELKPPAWSPIHFPQLPSQHSWKSTDVWPTRDKDARSMREKATEEGMLAEQALRKLAAAAKAGALKAESKKRNGNALAGVGRFRATRERPANEDIFGDVLQDVGGMEKSNVDGEESEDARIKRIEAIEIAEGLLVNANASHWRGGKRQVLAT